ncbi:unnamed protein product, partial [Mesorhabditis belari]|uniref:Uncharacterized protein n=1 Tax=Mesorhabditis belari TaxID=2138241 RepID=A0AAF3FIR9_9BILA
MATLEGAYCFLSGMSAAFLILFSLFDLLYITSTVSDLLPKICNILSWIVIFTNLLSVCFTLRKHHSRQTLNFVSSFLCQVVAVVWSALIFHHLDNSSFTGLQMPSACPIKILALIIAILLCCVEVGRISLVVLLLRRQRLIVPRGSILTLF